MNDIKKYHETIFEEIKRINEYGEEYWEARELMPLLEYTKWEIFTKLLKGQ